MDDLLKEYHKGNCKGSSDCSCGLGKIIESLIDIEQDYANKQFRKISREYLVTVDSFITWMNYVEASRASIHTSNRTSARNTCKSLEGTREILLDLITEGLYE